MHSLLSATVKEFRKLINICCSYVNAYSVVFFLAHGVVLMVLVVLVVVVMLLLLLFINCLVSARMADEY